MKEVELHCRKCKKNTGISYSLSGNPEAEILTGITMKCHTCKRVLIFRKYTEAMAVNNSYSNGKLYI